ncbi:MAG TPA: DUF58 domain-containing protein [Candidatus Margulisiibacteriota bacterium]|nr:DUF58 domain-containing protein [Candidatus Margulisiibacteriota bacterium]
MQPGHSGTDAATALAAVLAPGFLRKLDRLHLTVRRSLSTRPGNTPMPRGAQGSGIEIERHKTYDAGDDLRHLDWNAYGRLDELLIKTFRAEREAPLHIFIDASASMAVPADDGKFAFALGLAASLAYVSVRNHDPVRAVGLSAALPRACVAAPFLRHRSALHSLRGFLLQLQPQGETALAPGISAALVDQRSPGVAVVLSDFLVPPHVYEAALTDLLARRFTVAAVRVIGPAERDPTRLFRRAQLIDAETGRQRFVTLTADNLGRYERALNEHLAHLQAFCNRCGIAFCVADAGHGIERCVFRDLPAAGLVH